MSVVVDKLIDKDNNQYDLGVDASNVSGTLPIANGGTGATTAGEAMSNLILGMNTGSTISETNEYFPAASSAWKGRYNFTTLWNWIKSKLNISSAKGSSSIPVFVNSSGQVTACTDDFVHDGEDITGNAATATHLKHPQIVETSYKAGETANYWVNFADITQSNVNYHSGGNLFTVMPKALTAIMFSFRLPHDNSSTPEEFLYTSLVAPTSNKVGYTLDTSSGKYVYHFWIKITAKGRVVYNCIQQYAGNISGTLSDGTLDDSSTEPSGIVYASLGGVVSNAATADSATDYSSGGGIATAFNGKFNRIVIDSSGDTYDFNDWTSEGIYYFGGKQDGSYTFTNCPISTTTNTARFNLIVFTARSRVVQTCYINYQNDEPKIFTRSRNTGADTWTDWYRTAFRPTSAVGSSTRPIYYNSSGNPTQCGTSLAVDITGTAATATDYASSGGIATALDAKATDSDVVHIAGTETVTGTKTFSSNVSVSKSSWPMFVTKSTSNNMWTKWSTDNNGRVRIIESDNSGSSAAETAVVKYGTSGYEFKGNADTATKADSSSLCDQLPTVKVGDESTPVYWTSAGSFAKCTSVNADTVDGFHISAPSGFDTLYFI